MIVPVRENELPGKLIAVEGLDGSGKSTQVHLLKRWLELEGYKVFFTEWNSSVIVKEVTKKGKKRQLLTPTTFSLIHCTDFADRYERQVLPLLHAGYLVLADRYVFTAFGRDAVRGCDREWIRKLYSYARQPDVTFFFKVPLDVALGRILDGRPQLKHHEASPERGNDRVLQLVGEIGRIEQAHGKRTEYVPLLGPLQLRTDKRGPFQTYVHSRIAEPFQPIPQQPDLGRST